MKHSFLTFSVLLATAFGGTLKAQTDGNLDLAYGNNGSVISPVNDLDVFQDVVIQPDQKILAVGMSFDDTYTSHATVMRYLPDGSPDPDFGTNGVFSYTLDNEANIYSVVLRPDGKILLAGSTTDYTHYRILLIQLKGDGTPDPTFGTDGVVVQKVGPDLDYNEDMSYGLALDGNNNILVSGSSKDEAYQPRPMVVRFTPTGDLDSTFGVDGVAAIDVEFGENTFDCLTVQPDGKIVASGHYAEDLLWFVFLMARFNEDGSLDQSFGDAGIVKYSYSNVDDEGFDIELTPAGKILVAGFTATADYNYSALLMQFTAVGVLDSTFGLNGVIKEDIGLYDMASAIEFTEDGRIIMAGTSGVGPPNSFHMAVWKYNSQGMRDSTFGEDGLVQHQIDGFYAMIYGMDVQADGKIVLAGQARTTENDNHFLTVRIGNTLTTGLKGLNTSGRLSIYPNPVRTSEMVYINLNKTNSEKAFVEIYNAAGTMVVSQLPDNKSGNANFRLPETLAAGIYYLRISENGIYSASEKLLIIK